VGIGLFDLDPVINETVLANQLIKKEKTMEQDPSTPATLYQQVADELARSWQPGTRAYIEQHRPELAREIDEAETVGNKTWLAVEDGTGTLATFKQALETWWQANLKAIRAFADCQPLSLAGADPAEVAQAREQLRHRGYFLMHSQALGGQVAVMEQDSCRQNVPQGLPVYTLAEIGLLQQGVEAGNIVSIGDLRLLHEAKSRLGGVIVR